VELAIQKYGPDKVMLCSLTKAAARELASRESSVNPDMIGTLHAHAFRGLGRPRLAETKEGIASWNDDHPALLISATAVSPDNDAAGEASVEGKGRGDEYLQKVNLLRARCVAPERWPTLAREFYQQWCDWKKAAERVDFADLIDEAMVRLFTAPGSPNVIFADEAQDLSKAEHKLLSKWATKADSFVVVGDPDQSLFHWRGADPDIMDINRVPKENVRILSQSYRVPKAVHSAAMGLIGSIKDRAVVEYKPTEVEGFVLKSAATYENFFPVKDIILEHLDSGKSLMFLTSCAYMLNPIIKWLKDEGVPFGNPYASRWNPLVSAGTTKAIQLYDYLEPSKDYNKSPKFWSPAQLKTALHKVKSTGVLKRGWKKQLDAVKDDISKEDFALVVRDIFEEEALPKFLSFDLDWYKSLFGKAMDYPVSIVKRRGRQALLKRPQVTVGTIHSVKGGESDIVFLFPDLSYQGFLQNGQQGFGGRDAIKRMFYVGMTRAREGLILCKPCGSRYVKLGEGVVHRPRIRAGKTDNEVAEA